ncbi:MAG: 4Fe-4S binding protein [Synergistaceae bacterium]|nr:4Fe-4S binding protein [Synergistaceae bacterium]
MNNRLDNAALCAKVFMPDSIRDYFDCLYTDFDKDMLSGTDENGFVTGEYRASWLDHLYKRGVLALEAQAKGEYRYKAAMVDARLESFIVLEKAYWLSLPDDVRRAITDRYIMNPDIWIPKYIKSGDTETILPLEDCLRLVEESDCRYYNLAQCNCNNYIMGCAANKSDVCLSFESHPPEPNTPAHRGLTRAVTKEDALAVLRRADRQGLVHTYNAAHHHVCNCCPCCCVHHHRTEKYRDAIRRSYLRTPCMITAQTESCRHCGQCIKRCPFAVLSLGKDGVVIASDQCLGCGICRQACPAGVLRIVGRERRVKQDENKH